MLMAARRWDIPTPPDTNRYHVAISARHIFGDLCGQIATTADQSGSADPFPPFAAISEVRHGQRWLPVIQVQNRQLPIPPFIDLQGHPETDWEHDRLLVAYTMPEFFGTILRFWTSIDGDHIVSGGLGIAPREPEVHLELTYRDYLTARGGLVSWREAPVNSAAGVQASAWELLALASVPYTLDPVDADSIRELVHINTICCNAAATPPAPPPQQNFDPATVVVRLIAIQVRGLTGWVTVGEVEEHSPHIGEAIKAHIAVPDINTATATIPPGVPAQLIAVPLDDEPQLIAEGTNPNPLAWEQAIQNHFGT